MSETKFTKGPWGILPAEDDKEYFRIRGTSLGGRYKIANVIDLKFHHDGNKWCKLEREESMANANLIACAPDMYEMLEKANQAKRDSDYEIEHSDLLCDLYDEIESLLKRARGE